MKKSKIAGMIGSLSIEDRFELNYYALNTKKPYFFFYKKLNSDNTTIRSKLKEEIRYYII